ncbi:conserved Plasmodium protein, unknown function [Plasmodium ovale curtisi]|uniref:RNA polymerase sigma-70 region 3 domain-containing protein n=1 Tax=Plasmodium ovale curtisi TaxID=864141 RepID=A0A1A8WNB9_PLAOA|nr:conserved Plasmodium protein, unknown function [Plasmodium ovale curtisi]
MSRYSIGTSHVNQYHSSFLTTAGSRLDAIPRIRKALIYANVRLVVSYHIPIVVKQSNELVTSQKLGRKKCRKVSFKWNDNNIYVGSVRRRGISTCHVLEKSRDNVEKGKIKNETGKKGRHKANNYFHSLLHSNVLSKSVEASVNFDDGVINYFVQNTNPNIHFFVSTKGREKHIKNTEREKDVHTNMNEKGSRGKTIDEKEKSMQECEKDRKKKIRLKLKRGYLNDMYAREKKKLNDFLLSLKDKSIFKKKPQKIKEKILLLNGQTVNTEVIKQYLFHKLRLEYYENIRDQKKILTLDLWSKEINVPVENLKKLIVYIFKMKQLLQKEDEDLLIKTYFYNKTNMFSLFKNNYTHEDITSLDFAMPGEENQTKEGRTDMYQNDERNNKNLNITKNVHEKEKKILRKNTFEVSQNGEKNEYDIFADHFDNRETILYNDCENLINTEVQKFMQCIKDIVFFENSIYILEKFENRPPLLEELMYAYNYEKEEFLNKLENKIKLSQRLLIYFIPLISNTVKKVEANFNNSNLSEDDFLLVSLDAVKNGFKRYDVQKLGIKNLTKYVYLWTKNSTYNYYQKHKSFLSISSHTYQDYNKIKNYEDAFIEKNNRKPNIKEISDGLNISVEKIKKTLSSFINIVDAEKPLVYQNDKNTSHPEKNTYNDLIVNSDDIHSFNEIMYNDIVTKGLRNFICKSVKKKINKLIIFMKFGLFLEKRNYTDDEICEKLKITKKKFQKIFQNSINEIKNYIKLLKNNKVKLDANFDLTSYINFLHYDFLGNDFSQIAQ